MRASSKFIFLGAAFALLAGCNNGQDQAANAPPASASVGTQIDDSVITSKVKSALFADPDIKSFDLKVETRKNVVQLSGFVDNQAQIERALATTRGVEGVLGVDNSISLKPGAATLGSTVDDGVITTKVKSALLADPGIKSLDIAVVTRTGSVQLSGFVDSQGQIDQAVALVEKVPGVKSVDNELSVKK